MLQKIIVKINVFATLQLKAYKYIVHLTNSTCFFKHFLKTAYLLMGYQKSKNTFTSKYRNIYGFISKLNKEIKSIIIKLNLPEKYENV